MEDFQRKAELVIGRIDAAAYHHAASLVDGGIGLVWDTQQFSICVEHRRSTGCRVQLDEAAVLLRGCRNFIGCPRDRVYGNASRPGDKVCAVDDSGFLFHGIRLRQVPSANVRPVSSLLA